MQRILRFLASRRLGTVLVFVWALLLVTWVVPFYFYGLPSDRIIAIIGGEFFFRAIYGSVLVTTLACMIPRIATTVRRVNRVPSTDVEPRIGDGVQAIAPFDVASSREVLERLRSRSIVVSESWVWGVRRPYGPVGTLLFHGALLLLAAGVGVAYFFPGFSGSAIVSEGEFFASSSSAFESGGGEGSPPAVSFTVEEIEAEFFEDVLLFTRLEANVRTSDGRSREIAVSRPWFPDPVTLVRLEDFGYTLEVQDTFGTEPSALSAYKLNAFPSGTSDRFEYIDSSIGSNDRYEVEIVVYGDFVDDGEGPGAASYNLSNPYVKVNIDRVLSNYERRTIIDEQVVPVGTVLELPSGGLEIVGISEWGRFRIETHPSAPMFGVGLVLALLGLIVRMVFPRQEIIIAERDGGIIVSARFDLYGTASSTQDRVLKMLQEADGER